MARLGRGQPQGTQYQAVFRVAPDFGLAGAANITLTAVGAVTLVSSVFGGVAAPEEHRFRSVQVPALTDFDAVQRQMQRNLDEIARAVNPIRSIPDGGTGLDEVTSGSLMVGSGSTAMETVPIGTQDYVLTVKSGMPTWFPAPGSAGGEANTASNVGSAGTGLFDAKVGIDLQFRKVNAGSAKVTVTLDAANKKVDLDVVEAQLLLQNLGGTLASTQLANRRRGTFLLMGA